MKVTNVDQLKKKMEQIRAAQEKYATYTQEQVDKIFREAAMAALDARIPLAKMAVEESRMGIFEDKVIKNHLASEYVYNKYKNEKTCGILETDDAFGITKVAEPIGVVAAIVPTTNPTSTAIFKALISLKTRNGVIFSPHPRAKKSTIEAARIVLDAAVKAGAPEGIIGWIDEPSIELSGVVMKEADIILATGGPAMVKAAYSSGKPALGVGAGNTPVIIDETAHIKMAVNSILLSKTFDNGVICASEQAIIVIDKVYDEIKNEFIERGSYFLTGDEIDKVRKTVLINGAINGDIVGQSAFRIAQLAGIEVPEDTKVLIGEVELIGPEEPLSHEKLSPVLAMYKAKTFDDALDKACKILAYGGMGHTSVLYTNELTCKDRIEAFGAAMKTSRTFVNMPASHGAAGDTYNFRIAPSFTLGCGSWGGKLNIRKCWS
ncbi:aldehyde dehydrogenase family protein [Clostridium chromiireducens]|uniref:Aldehyde dehydrogenase family protein n=1 Tax=Clostridium chromiireducens TaxID=225345 RepID=A0A964RJM1_9CLOT|nr:aldehyde dehydrogenase family protein [Clostridium chromiireducens]